MNYKIEDIELRSGTLYTKDRRYVTQDDGTGWSYWYAVNDDGTTTRVPCSSGYGYVFPTERGLVQAVDRLNYLLKP